MEIYLTDILINGKIECQNISNISNIRMIKLLNMSIKITKYKNAYSWMERERESSILLDILSNMLVLRRRGTIKETEIANRCNKESWKHMKESSGDLGDDSLTNQKIFLDAYMS